MRLNIVILTGGREGHKQLLAGTGLANKALLPVGGRPMVCSVFEAAAATRYKTQMFISTGDPDIMNLEMTKPFTVLPSEDNAVQSFLRSLERVPGEDHVLFISGDHPLLTPEMIEHFVDESLRRELDFAIAVVSRKLVQRDYPQSRRTYLPVRGDGISGANMYLVHKKRFTQANVDFMEAIDRNRKQHWKSIFLMDPITIIQGLLRMLDAKELVERGSRKMGCKTSVVMMPWAECCMDVDKVSDKVLAEQILSRRAQLLTLPGADPSCAPSENKVVGI